MRTIPQIVLLTNLSLMPSIKALQIPLVPLEPLVLVAQAVAANHKTEIAILGGFALPLCVDGKIKFNRKMIRREVTAIIFLYASLFAIEEYSDYHRYKMEIHDIKKNTNEDLPQQIAEFEKKILQRIEESDQEHREVFEKILELEKKIENTTTTTQNSITKLEESTAKTQKAINELKDSLTSSVEKSIENKVEKLIEILQNTMNANTNTLLLKLMETITTKEELNTMQQKLLSKIEEQNQNTSAFYNLWSSFYKTITR